MSGMIPLIALVLLLVEVRCVGGQQLQPLQVCGNRIGYFSNSSRMVAPCASPDAEDFVPVQLRGMDVTGALFNCVANRSIFDGNTDNAYIDAILSWHASIVRIPMNEDCWLGADYISNETSGTVYQAAVVAYVETLVRRGLYVVFDLHWVRGGLDRATQQQPMPDGRVPEYWTSVTRALKNLSGHVILDLFNEPFPNNNARESPAAWACWRHGGSSCQDLNYTAVGFDSLVSQIRASGSDHIFMIGGINYANDLDAWVENAPVDPLRRLVASWHAYNFNACTSEACWNTTIAPVISHFPVIAGEIGENDCKGEFISPLMRWLDAHNTSYMAWVFLPWSCDAGPALISNYNGTCTDSYGCTFQAHLAAAHRLHH